MNKCNQLRNSIQRLIDNGQVSTSNPITQPNQKMGIFQDPLPRHNNDVHYVSIEATQQVLHDYNSMQSNEFYSFISTNSKVPFIGSVDITSDYEFTSHMNPPLAYQIVEVHDVNMVGIATHIGHGVDRPPPPSQEMLIQQPTTPPQVQVQTQAPRPIVTIQTHIEQQLRTTQTKLFLWGLLQQLLEHKQALNTILKAIELDVHNPNSFGDFIGVVQTTTRPSITFFQYEIQHSNSERQKYPTLYIVAYVDSHPLKWVMIDNGSTINVISSIAFERLKIPTNFLNAPTLTIQAFNNTLETIMGTVVLPIRVDVREISMNYHVVEGEMQYNLLLGHPWIEDMEVIPSTLHRCLKYLHKGTVHCIIGDPNPFSHCNSTFAPDSSQMPYGHLFSITVLVNNHPGSTSSCSLEPTSSTLSPIPSIVIS